MVGLEPTRCCHRGILNPLRLPIPPHPQKLKNTPKLQIFKNYFQQ
tara:strand:- start:1072 stop:1206 length:135 start_codon:yes stop_codon:yes gene_type:complete